MQNYKLTLACDASDSYRCVRAANSLDINVEEKLTHEFNVSADFETDYNIGLIVGASGSGKSTFANHVFSEHLKSQAILDLDKTILDQMPESSSYDDLSEILCGVGLSSVPCWIRPVKTLSNGQQFRAQVALQIAHGQDVIVIDEWTSVVDRTVAKIMSHNIQKYIRKLGKKIILVSCHYDVIEWLNPCWIVDCNAQSYTDRRSLWRDFKRLEQIKFCIKEIDGKSWKMFSKYHYLSKNVPVGKNYYYGLFLDDKQIGFQCFSNYVPRKKGEKVIYHSNRTVIHPDYCGIGLGVILINKCSQVLHDRFNGLIRVMGRFSSIPVYKSMVKYDFWSLQKIETRLKSGKTKLNFGARAQVKMFLFEFIRSKYYDSKNITPSC